MSISYLHARFIDFAAGMPAIAFSRSQLVRELMALQKQLAGSYPDKPASAMADIPLPLYKLAYSVFLRSISVSLSSSEAELNAKLTATIHPRYHPDQIIREYDIVTSDPIVMTFDYDSHSRQLFWRQNGISIPTITGKWGADADDILETTDIPKPKKDNFLKEVEQPILWSTGNTFVNLLLDALPIYDLGEIVPWLTLLDPLRFDFGGEHLIITASRAQIKTGGCFPKIIPIEPDPDFPYEVEIPKPTFSAKVVDLAVYIPKTRFIDFVSDSIEPAVLINYEARGGIIKWRITGSFGIKKFFADISTGFVIGDPNAQGVIGVGTAIDFVGAARAWVDGPCGTKIGLAGASVLGTGEFAADIKLSVNLPAGFIEGNLVVTKSELSNVDFDSGLPWPISEIADAILEHIAKKEIRKLARKVVYLGRWEFMGIPLSYVDAYEGEYFEPVAVLEGLKGVSNYTGVARKEG